MEIELHFTDGQIKKAIKEQTFQATASQLQKEPNVVVSMTNADAKRLTKNIKSNKGFRFQPSAFELIEGDDIDIEEKEGGGFFKRFKKSVNKTANNVAQKAKKVAKSEVKVAGRELNRELDTQTGYRVGDYSGNIKNLKKQGKVVAEQGIRETINGTAGALGNYVGGPGAGLVASEMADTYISDRVVKQTNKGIDGAGATKKQKFIKGSQEAKDFMASLRAKRSGGNKVIHTVKSPMHPKETTGGSVLGRALKHGGSANNQPTGSGTAMRLSLRDPSILKNDVNKKISGGSFIPY